MKKDNKKDNNKQQSLCPCDSGLDYAICCGRYHQGKIHAPTAEALMRSRYSAYAMGNAQYLYRTWHEKTRPTLQSLREAGPSKLVALKILTTQAGGVDDDKGMVEFVASYAGPDNQPGEDAIEQYREKSLFVKLKGRWLYIDAV